VSSAAGPHRIHAGEGSFVWVESVAKTNRPAAEYFENAHKEYLEAIVEGGVIRFALPLILVVGLLAAVGRGPIQRRDRSIGPLLLGAWFGLAVGIVHSCVDFAIHMPAVALITAVVAGYAMAAASDADYLPRKILARSPTPTPTPREASPASGGNRRGGKAAAVLLGLAGIALWAALDAFTRERVHRLKLAADVTYWEKDHPNRLARRADYLDRRAALRPHDSSVLFDAGQGHIDAAVEATVEAEPGSSRFPPEVVERHLVPALRFFRAARQANPIAPKTHTRLALYSEYFARSEPAEVHFERAKRLLATDPDLWFASGKVAFRHGRFAAAWADWKQSLALAPVHLTQILTSASGQLTHQELCERLLPDDPATVWAAMNQLVPNRAAQAAERHPFLIKGLSASNRGSNDAGATVALALIHEELGHTDEAYEAWQRALALAPHDVGLRNEFSRWLEREERYEEAIPHLEWLRERNAAGAIQDRLDGARHGLKLNRGLGSK
jgi:tetratricopeptide (TPR) repeat protein